MEIHRPLTGEFTALPSEDGRLGGSQTPRDRVVYRDIWASVGFRAPSDTARAVIDSFAPAPGAARPRLADLGCGAGRHSLHAARQGLKVTALDHSPHAIAMLGKAVDAEGLDCDVIQGDSFAWLREQPPGSLDAIICFDSVHHSSPDPEQVAETLTLLGTRTRAGGSVLVTLLCDISYSTGERPPGRLLIDSEGAAALLDHALGDHLLVTERCKPVRVDRTTSISPATGEPVQAAYRATRVLRHYRIV
jgi:SAM-dependent methyltransferase